MSFEPLTIQSEPYSRTGSISAQGVSRLLGKPNLSPLELVVRESVQNSWDARLQAQTENSESIPAPEYRIRWRRLNQEQRAALRDVVLPNAPIESSSCQELIQAVNSDELAALEIADFGTVGLGGPTDASVVPESGESTNFVDFVRNLGTPRDVELGGGTYGYGKSSLYAISGCSTIVIHTQTAQGETRLLAAHLGDAFDRRNLSTIVRHTLSQFTEQHRSALRVAG